MKILGWRWVHVCAMLSSRGLRTRNKYVRMGYIWGLSDVFDYLPSVMQHRCPWVSWWANFLLASTWCRSSIILGMDLKRTYTCRRAARSGRLYQQQVACPARLCRGVPDLHMVLWCFSPGTREQQLINQRATIDKLWWFYNCESICLIHIYPRLRQQPVTALGDLQRYWMMYYFC